MSKAISKVSIAIPKSQAWEKLQDLSLAHNYVPGIIKTEITTAQKTGVGASRKVYQSKSKALQETVVEWNEGEGFKIRLHKGDKDAPFKNAYFQYQLAEGPNNTTELTAIMGYEPPLGKFGKALDNLFLNKVITKVINDVALSMKLFYETNQPTKKSDLKKLKSRLG